MVVIRDIEEAGLEPIHVIYRHGMKPKTSLEVETTLIDETPGLANLSSSHDSNERGPANVKQLRVQYNKPEIKFDFHNKILVIKIRRGTFENRSLWMETEAGKSDTSGLSSRRSHCRNTAAFSGSSHHASGTMP